MLLDGDLVVCPLLRTLIIHVPGGPFVPEWQDSLLKTVSGRMVRGNAIWRLRVIVPSEERVQLYFGIFDPFVQEIEIVMCQPEQKEWKRLFVWED